MIARFFRVIMWIVVAVATAFITWIGGHNDIGFIPMMCLLAYSMFITTGVAVALNVVETKNVAESVIYMVGAIATVSLFIAYAYVDWWVTLSWAVGVPVVLAGLVIAGRYIYHGK